MLHQAQAADGNIESENQRDGCFVSTVANVGTVALPRKLMPGALFHQQPLAPPDGELDRLEMVRRNPR